MGTLRDGHGNPPGCLRLICWILLLLGGLVPLYLAFFTDEFVPRMLLIACGVIAFRILSVWIKRWYTRGRNKPEDAVAIQPRD